MTAAGIYKVIIFCLLLTPSIALQSSGRSFRGSLGLRKQTQRDVFSRLDHFSDPQTDAVIQCLAYGIGAYLLFYKPVERTKMVLDKVSELLRVGDSQDLLSDLDKYDDAE